MGPDRCFSNDAVEQIRCMITDIQRDEQFAALGAIAHLPRRQPQCIQDHVALSMEDYSKPVRICLRAGFTLDIAHNGKARVIAVLSTCPGPIGS